MFIGNSSIREYFNKLLKSDNLSHAYLFYGPEGVGKKSFALKLATELCGTSTDLKFIDKGAEEILISDIRELKSFIHLTPFGKNKVVIINNVHNLGRDASNALLKILEEPPGKAVLFLISHLPQAIIPTVASRCQLVRFRPFKENEITAYLINEKKIKKEFAGSVAKLSRGSLGLALEIAENFNNFQKNITLLYKLIKADFGGRFETAKKIVSDQEGLKKTVIDWLVYSASLPDKKFAKKILYLNNVISKSHYNHRLALENFLTNL